MTRRHKLHRRDFIKFSAVGAGAALAGTVISSCGGAPPHVKGGIHQAHSPTPTTPPPEVPTTQATAVPSPTTSPAGRVALVRTDDRSEGVRRALDLLESDAVKGKSIFLKPNLNSSDPFPGSTHPETLLALSDSLNSMGAGHLTVGDRSGMGNTRAVMRGTQVLEMAEELGWSAVVFDELDSDDWNLFQPEGSHWESGFALPRPVLQADGIVQTCCLKTHRFGGHFTLSLKNSVGLVAKRIPGRAHDFMTELHNSPNQRLMIAEINVPYQPDLILLDGMEAFVDGGPDRGTKVVPGVILASQDRIAIDAVGVAILRYFGTTPEVAGGDIYDQEQIRRAAELGLGANSTDEISLITSDARSESFSAPIRDLLAAG